MFTFRLNFLPRYDCNDKTMPIVVCLKGKCKIDDKAGASKCFEKLEEVDAVQLSSSS